MLQWNAVRNKQHHIFACKFRCFFTPLFDIIHDCYIVHNVLVCVYERATGATLLCFYNVNITFILGKFPLCAVTVGVIIVKPPADSTKSPLVLNMLSVLLSVCHKHSREDKTFFKWTMSVNCCLMLKNCCNNDVKECLMLIQN